jgi:NAD(P)-dependent dehydrogenase (short-subunit alcohol dehydrogenase family)
MEMTQDVMANSLVYWVQDLYRAGFLEKGSKVYAMTSEGTSRVIPSYGVVSGAKAAMESHVRQLAMEFARRGDGIAVNSIRAGVTDTPGASEDSREPADDRRDARPQPARPADDDAGRRRRDRPAVGNRLRTGSAATSSVVDGGEFVTVDAGHR